MKSQINLHWKPFVFWFSECIVAITIFLNSKVKSTLSLMLRLFVNNYYKVLALKNKTISTRNCFKSSIIVSTYFKILILTENLAIAHADPTCFHTLSAIVNVFHKIYTTKFVSLIGINQLACWSCTKFFRFHFNSLHCILGIFLLCFLNLFYLSVFT